MGIAPYQKAGHAEEEGHHLRSLTINLSLVASFALSGPLGAQTQLPPDPTAAATPGTQNPSHSDASTATPAEVERQAGLDAQMRGVSAGAAVQSPAGESIGAVKDIVPDPKTGRPAYVLIATHKGPKVAVPYSVVITLVHNGYITLDRSRLERAPQVRDRQLLDQSDTAWRREANRYWSGRD